jgi:hypothetical protein
MRWHYEIIPDSSARSGDPALDFSLLTSGSPLREDDDEYRFIALRKIPRSSDHFFEKPNNGKSLLSCSLRLDFYRHSGKGFILGN